VFLLVGCSSEHEYLVARSDIMKLRRMSAGERAQTTIRAQRVEGDQKGDQVWLRGGALHLWEVAVPAVQDDDNGPQPIKVKASWERTNVIFGGLLLVVGTALLGGGITLLAETGASSSNTEGPGVLGFAFGGVLTAMGVAAGAGGIALLATIPKGRPEEEKEGPIVPALLWSVGRATPPTTSRGTAPVVPAKPEPTVLDPYADDPKAAQPPSPTGPIAPDNRITR
jgi:hypothetical protein